MTLVSVLALLAVAACNKSDAHQGQDHASHQAADSSGEQATTGDSQGVVAIDVGDQGFQPSRVELKKGQEATLRFTRTSDKTCATEVVFPDLKMEKKLPLNQAVDVKVPTGEARELVFQCGMGMYKSAVVIH